ncbi:MAG: hypothetical protein M3133_08165 [Actinomycetota bacterium]|nr:hypothetical protein [Actinomycetota bacterium]
MARVLIVGCGCRGRALASSLLAEGFEVRGTTRHAESIEGVEAAGAEGRIADPDRLSTLVPHLEGVSVLCWLMGTVVGEPELVAAIHGPRLESMLEELVDTPVRGVVYEAAGSVSPDRLESGARLVARAAATHRMPVRAVDQDPREHEAWLAAMRAAVRGVLAG